MNNRVLVVTSPGGHFDLAMALLPALEGYEVTFVTNKNRFLSGFSDPLITRKYEIAVFSDYIDIKLFLSLCFNFFELLMILAKVRPRAILSTGAEIAIPAFVLARLFSRAVLVHVETATRPGELSLSGKILLRLSHRFFVQWPEQVEILKGKAEYRGAIV